MIASFQLHTPKLTLIEAHRDHLSIEIETPSRLAEALQASVPESWPPGEYDLGAMNYFRDCLDAGGDSVRGWYAWYAMREADGHAPRTLVGAAGYFGPPDSKGVVEIGYSVAEEWRRRGYALEIVNALVARAFGQREVTQVMAHVLADNHASIGVLSRCGFVADGEDEHGRRFLLLRPMQDMA